MDKILPQDSICRCRKRIGDHDQYQLWVCLQNSNRQLNRLALAVKEHLEVEY
jgi:hypothetical protein